MYHMKAWMNRESSTLFFLRAPNYGYCASKVFRSWVCLNPSLLLTYQSLGYVLDQFRQVIEGEGCLCWYICASGVIRYA